MNTKFYTVILFLLVAASKLEAQDYKDDIQKLTTKKDYETLYTKGLDAFEVKKFKTAFDYFYSSYGLDRNSYTSYYLARTLSKLGHKESAEEYAKASLLRDRPYITKDMRKELHPLIKKDTVTTDISLTFGTGGGTPKDLAKLAALKKEFEQRRKFLDELAKHHGIPKSAIDELLEKQK